ncbi:MAG: T9SS type A sorting domain-containing protein [Flavobacteriales bacterium]|nr:T9SS type A sorting domain-containing protein [Flavobacteriales bacterium]
MKNKYYLLFALLLTGSFKSVSAQETFAMIHQMLQTRCSGNGCHNGTSSTFNVDQSASDLYADLVNADPLNPTAAAKNNKLIKPGYPTRSFLLRKVAHGLSDVLALETPAEGAPMPDGGGQLADNEVELIRQWIIFGAPETGAVVDTALINTYYREGGINDTYADHAAPAEGEGFQMYMGRLFVPPLSEHEYYMKFDPQIATGIEVTKVETFMPQQTHHFVIYSFNPGADAAYVDGLRDAYDPGAQNSHADIKNPIATGPGAWNYDLPPGTAYFWPAHTVFDMNIHIKNSSTDSILATDMYMNVYTQTAGTTQHYMQIKLFPDLDISIPQDNQEHIFTQVADDQNATHMWKVWNLYTHTHKYGTMYNAYVRNPDGSKGEQLYNGNYSYELGFDAGYYRTGPEVTFRYFPDNDLYEIDPRLGIIHEAGFVNTAGPDPVNWGLTSDDEMMVLGVQFIEGETLTGIEEAAPIEGLRIYPNPTNGNFTVNFNLLESADVNIELMDMLGKRIATLPGQKNVNGMYSQTFDAKSLNLKHGMYMVKITVNGASVTQKLMLTE